MICGKGGAAHKSGKAKKGITIEYFGAKKNSYHMGKKMRLDLYMHMVSYAKMIYRWTKERQVWNLKNMYLYDTEVRNDFLNMA